MAFWANFESYAGKTNFGVKLIDKLALPAGKGGWVAGLNMATYSDGKNYYLSNELHHTVAPRLEVESVYFLSWAVDDVTRVTFETLASFNYFLTSEFSGCRFVVTETGVAHVAWSAGGNRSKGIGTPELRDGAEKKTLYGDGKFLPEYRRKLSFTSGSSCPLDTDLWNAYTDNSSQSYNGDRALVFGRRINGGWHFKVLRYSESAGSENGVWASFAGVYTTY